MPRGSRGEKRPADVIGNAVLIAKIATGEEAEVTYKQSTKVKSGKAGAIARAERLSASSRQEIAKKAAKLRWSREDQTMRETAREKLHTLLFEEGRELVNIKFLPGEDRGLTPERLAAAAHKALRSALSRERKHAPPTTGRAKRSFA